MAKISSYPSDANVTTSDRLIGSDNENSNETKNFQIGDIINLASSIIVPPGGFVPYTGATANVDLGAYDINADAATFTVVTSPEIYVTDIFNKPSSPSIIIGSDTNPVGLLINTSTNIFRLGDYNGNFNATNISIEDGSSRISFVGGFNLSNGQGTSGQVLTSAGAGATPTWTSLPSLTGFVPYTGATGNVNLGIYSLTSSVVSCSAVTPNGGSIYLGNIFNDTSGIYVPNGQITTIGDAFFNGNGTSITIDDNTERITFVGLFNLVNGVGTAGQVLTSGGTGAVPSWTSLSASFVPYTGATANVDLGAFGLTTSYLTSSFGILIDGAAASISLDGDEGGLGEVMISTGPSSTPVWSNLSALITSNLYKGNFYDSITQTLAAANTATPVILRNTDAPTTNGISIVTDGTNLTRITFANAGVYNILFSAQLANSGGTGQTVDFWLRKNGSTAAANIPHTNGKVQLQGNAAFLMAAWNYFIDVAAGDYIQLVWAATSTNITMVAAAANGVHPETPSIIVTANVV